MAYELLQIRVRPELRQAIDEILLQQRRLGLRVSLNGLLVQWIEAKIQETWLATKEGREHA